jgi:hypothetical protein
LAKAAPLSRRFNPRATFCASAHPSHASPLGAFL